MAVQLEVKSNQPRRRRDRAGESPSTSAPNPGASAPAASPSPPTGPTFTPPEQPAQQRFWTEEKAQKAIAYACRALVPIAGPNMRASEFELEMAGGPLAAVLNDFWPMPSSEAMSTQANLLVLLVVVGFMALVRLPDLKAAWDKSQEQKKRPDPEQPAARVAPTPVEMTPRPHLVEEQPAAPAKNGEARKAGWELFNPGGDYNQVGSGRL